MTKSLIVDGNNLTMRAVHAAERSFMHHDGDPTGPLLIVINMLSRYVRENRPERMIVCFDSGRSRFRTEMYPQYKQGRADRPLDEKGPFSQFKQFLTLSGIHHTAVNGWEADDLIAAFVGAEDPTEDVKILSGDKDMLQLVNRRIVQIRPTGVGDEEWNYARVMQHYGIPARRYSEYLALVGDTSDGVPGVRGVGPKRATALMEAHDTWEGVVAALKSDEDREMARLCYRLVDLPYAVRQMKVLGISFLPAPKISPADSTKSSLIAFLNGYGMDSVVEKVAADTLWREG